MCFVPMVFSLPPRSVRLTAFGTVIYGFLTTLTAAMLLGPPISFFLKDSNEQMLLERGVLTHFDLTAARPTRNSSYLIDYVFYARDVPNGASVRLNRESIISDEAFAIFANPENRFVIYDPLDPGNAIPVTSRSALAEQRYSDRRFAVWFYPISSAVILAFSLAAILALRRKLRLLRHGLAAPAVVTRLKKNWINKPCVEFQFTDADAKIHQGCRCFNFRIGIGGSFAPFVVDAIVFFDPNNPRIYELFLPRLAMFKFLKS